MKIIDRNEKQRHESDCQLMKISCSCGEKIERGKLNHHVAEKCPENYICCEYESHGCLWQGKRKEYWKDHESECKVRQLYRDFCQLKKNTNLETDIITKIYKKSDCFIITGLSGEPTFRKQLLCKYIKSNLELKFPIKIGSTSKNEVRMTSLITRYFF